MDMWTIILIIYLVISGIVGGITFTMFQFWVAFADGEYDKPNIFMEILVSIVYGLFWIIVVPIAIWVINRD